jgi:Lhr-like helicase
MNTERRTMSDDNGRQFGASHAALGPVEDWFARRRWAPFPFQREVWETFLAGAIGLIHASTGTGKTYAAWMGPLLEWLNERHAGEQPAKAVSRRRAAPAPPLRVLWITPLRALAADTEAALRAPLDELGLPWTLERRTGDTSAAARARQRRRLPTALVTTPESISLLAYRLARLRPISFTIAVNDYGFELLSPDPALLEQALAGGDQGQATKDQNAVIVGPSPLLIRPLLAAAGLLDTITAGLNATEMARRQFREIARVAGLVFQGYPGGPRSAKQLQASSGLLYDVFARYDPRNLLLRQAEREVLERQLEQGRLAGALARLRAGRVTVMDVQRPTPLAFPLLVERLRETVSSEKLADRVRRMQLSLEQAADAAHLKRSP